MAGPQHERIISPLKVIDFAGDVVLVECRKAPPPGSRVRFEIPGEDGSGARPVYRGKLVDLRKTPSGAFEMKLRIHSASREMRFALEALVSGVTGE